MSSTASTEVGLLTRSGTALASDKSAESITNVFTTTELVEDTKRATLPMTDAMEDSTPVGVSLDLSSRDKVYKPIPSDEEIEDSPGPLPGFWVLTHEGILCSWWIIYTDSIKQGLTYSGLAAVEGNAPTPTPTQPTQAASASPFSKPSGSVFGSSPSPAPAFGAPSQMGQKPSPFGSNPSAAQSTTGGAAFGSSTFGSSPAPSAPTFGKPSTIGFGQPSQLGMRASPFASAAGSTPAFGQSGFSSFANNSNKSAFGGGSAAPSSGGFAGFANKGGFAAAAGNNEGGSVFGSANKPSGTSFGGGSTFGSASSTSFPPKQDKPSGSVFGSTPFQLQSSFKPDSSKDGQEEPSASSGSTMFGSGFGSALKDAGAAPASSALAQDDAMDDSVTFEEVPIPETQSAAAAPLSPESTTPTTTPAPNRFGLATSPAPGTSLFGQPTNLGMSSTSLFGSKPSQSPFSGSSIFSPKQDATPSADGKTSDAETPKIKVEEQDAPLPPDTTSKVAYPLGDSSSSSATSNPPNLPVTTTTTPTKPEAAPLPPDFAKTPKPANSAEDAPLPPDFTKSAQAPEAPLPPDFVKVLKTTEKEAEAEDAPLPPDFVKPSKPAVPDPPTSQRREERGSSSEFIAPKAPSKEPSAIPSLPESVHEESDFEDNVTEGSGVDVAKDLSPSTSGLTPTPGFTPQSSFGGKGGKQEPERSRPLFGEISRNAPTFPRPNATSPRSPSPVRGAVPNRMLRTDATRSVSAPGMASQILGPKSSQSQLAGSIVGKERQGGNEDPFLLQHRRTKARQEAEEMQLLVDEEDDDMQKILASEVEGTLNLDEFIAHSNVAGPAKESIPSQVEAVYRDINAMIDTLGLNSRTVKAFIRGNTEQREPEGRARDDLENPNDWVLCEVDELGEVLDEDMYPELEDSRVQDLESDLETCQDLSRDMQRLRAKQEDLKKTITTRMDPGQAELAMSLPLSAEQATQQNELRKEFAKFSKLLAETEESLTMLKTKIVSSSGLAGKGGAGVPTVEAVMRTITKMTTMVEKRSGDIDVLETQLRRVRLESRSRDGSPVVTPQGKRNSMFSPESTPSRNFRQSLTSSIGPLARGTPPRKKLSGFSQEEKGDLMEKRTRRQAVLDKLKDSVEKKGVTVWNLEDID